MKLTKIPDNCGRAKHAISYGDKTVMSRFWSPFPENHPYTLLKVVGYYDLSGLSMSVMSLQKKVWMGGGWVGGVSSIQNLFGFFEFFLTLQSPLWKWKVTLIGTGRSNLTSSRSCVQSSGTNVPLTMSSVFQRSVRDWSLVSGLPLCCKTVQRRWQLEIV